MGKERIKSSSELGLQVIPADPGVELVFTVSDGNFPGGIEEARTAYQYEVDSETKEIRILRSILGAATLFQVYQVAEGVRNENPDVIIPVAIVATLMFYIEIEI